MLKLKKVTLRNFLSVGNVMQTVNLEADGVTLVLGENLDLGGGGSRNGVGKTSLLNAICYALYGLPLLNIKKDNLVNNINEKNMEVSIEFEKNGHQYKIERGRKPNYLRYLVNNQIVNAPDTDESEGDSKWTQFEIEKILGLTHTMFKHIVGLNTYTDPFLALRSGDQRPIIEQLLGITQLSEKAENLKKQLTQTRSQIESEEKTIDAQTKANASIQKTIDDLKRKSSIWDFDKSKKISELQEQKEAIGAIDFDYEIAQFDLLDNYKSQKQEFENAITFLNAEIKNFDSSLIKVKKEYNDLKNNNILQSNEHAIKIRMDTIDRSTSEITRKNLKVEKYYKELEEVADQISNPNQHHCSTCGQGLTGTDHLQKVISNLENRLLEIDARIKAENDDINSLNENIKTATAEISAIKQQEEKQIKELEKKLFEKEQEIKTISNELSIRKENILVMQQSIKDLGLQPETIFKSRQDAYEAKAAYNQIVVSLSVEENTKNPYIDQIHDLETNAIKVISYENLNKLTKHREHQEFLLKLLTNKDSFIRKKIIDQNLTYLNARLLHYLSKLGLPHQVRFLNDLSVQITQLGREVDFDNLSRGERTRLILGLSWSFRDIFESLNSPISLIFIDELLDNGLDPTGLEASLEVIKKIGRERHKNIFLISHRDELTSRVNSILYVRKENGFTSFDSELEATS